MGWVGEGEHKRWQSQYRIVERDGWFMPQQEYLVRGALRWFSLLRDGQWADPDSWNVDAGDGENLLVLMQTREMAEAAVSNAKRANGDQ